jgi:hypothetical protein
MRETASTAKAKINDVRVLIDTSPLGDDDVGSADDVDVVALEDKGDVPVETGVVVPVPRVKIGIALAENREVAKVGDEPGSASFNWLTSTHAAFPPGPKLHVSTTVPPTVPVALNSEASSTIVAGTESNHQPAHYSLSNSRPV